MRISCIRIALMLRSSGGVTRPALLRSDTPDAVIERGFDGRPRIPGTSLAGALRARFREVHGESEALRVFGTVTGSIPHASAIWVYDAMAAEATVAASTRTAVARHRGAAASHALTTIEQIEAGAVLEAFVRWDDATDDDLTRFWEALSAWTPTVGRGTSSGAGTCEIGEVRFGHVDLATDEGLLTWLTSSGPELLRQVAMEPAPVDAPRSTPLRVTCTIASPLTVSTGRPAEGNLIAVRREGGNPVIPGTSIKGVVRSRMEYILRSVGVPVCGAKEGKPSCGECLTCKIFGYGGASESERDTVGARGRVRAITAVIVPLPGESDVVVRPRPRVSIDRFTGGAATRTVKEARIALSGQREGRLFAVEAVERGAFDMAWDVSGLDTRQTLDFNALLRLVCDDFADGLVGLGLGVTAGYGWIKPDPTCLDRIMNRADAQHRLSEIVGRHAVSPPEGKASGQ